MKDMTLDQLKKCIGQKIHIQENTFVEIKHVEERMIDVYHSAEHNDFTWMTKKPALFISDNGYGWHRLYPHQIEKLKLEEPL